MGSLCYIASNEVVMEKESQKDNNDYQLHNVQETNEEEILYEETDKLREKCISNVTACHFQWQNYQHVICLANERLTEATHGQLSEKSFSSTLKAKTLYRRGVSHAEIKNYEEALSDLNDVLIIEPTNKAASQRLKDVKSNRHKID